MRHQIRIILASVMIGWALAFATTEADTINTNGSEGAISGYDVVAYFDGRSRHGHQTHRVNLNEGEFWFSSADNKARFLENPERFLPEFGGHCAYGVRMGRRLPVDPEIFMVHDDKLYLLLDRATKRMFAEDLARNLEIAERLWPQVKHQPFEN